MNKKNIDIKSEGYYRRERSWTNHFNIINNAKILDIGCGHGLLGAYLKENHCATVHGIEVVESCFKAAEKILDKAFFDDIEKMALDEFEKDYDYIIFSDCLEHLVNPDLVLKKVRTLLKKDGFLLISIPNVQNFRITMPLIFKGSWEYTNEGLMDKTHLRWFTCSSIKTLVEENGFHMIQMERELPLSSISGILNKVSLTLLKNHLTSHFYLKACLKDF